MLDNTIIRTKTKSLFRITSRLKKGFGNRSIRRHNITDNIERSTYFIGDMMKNCSVD
jgi:hypothetical protein